MKNLKILIAVLGFTFFCAQTIVAQSENNVEAKVYATTVTKTPEKVKEALKSYSDFVISSKATFTKKSNGNIYRIQVTKRNWSHYLLINENGKIIGIDAGEHSSVVQ